MESPADAIRGPLVFKRFCGFLGTLRLLLTGLIVILTVQTTMLVLRISGVITLNPFVMLFMLFTMVFESMILLKGFGHIKKNVTPRLAMIWTRDLDWDLYENGILVKAYEKGEPSGVKETFYPFARMSKAVFFPKGPAVEEIYRLFVDSMGLRAEERPLNAGLAGAIQDRIWFIDREGKLLDPAPSRRNIRAGAIEPLRKLLEHKVKVIE
jgi:hypothetical protein